MRILLLVLILLSSKPCICAPKPDLSSLIAAGAGKAATSFLLQKTGTLSFISSAVNQEQIVEYIGFICFLMLLNEREKRALYSHNIAFYISSVISYLFLLYTPIPSFIDTYLRKKVSPSTSRIVRMLGRCCIRNMFYIAAIQRLSQPKKYFFPSMPSFVLD